MTWENGLFLVGLAAYLVAAVLHMRAVCRYKRAARDLEQLQAECTYMLHDMRRVRADLARREKAFFALKELS